MGTNSKEYMKAWRDSHLEQLRKSERERARKNRANNPEKFKKYNRDYYYRNHEKSKEKNRNSQRKHRDKRRIWEREYHRRNPSKSRNQLHARKERLKKSADLTATQWEFCLNYWHNCCAICGNQTGFWRSIVADHWIPLAKGGITTAKNILPLCHGQDGCNNSKSNSDPIEWLYRKFGKRKGKQIADRVKQYFDHLI